MNDEQHPAPLYIFGAANQEQNEQLARDAQAIVDADVAALPKDCSGTPASCPDNEGHGCACSPIAAAPQVVADERALSLLSGISRTIISLRDGWGDKNDADEAIANIAEVKSALEAAPVQAQEPVACKTCGGAGIVSDGEINAYPDGTPYMNGPVKCVKDCPDCAKPVAPVQPVAVPDGWKLVLAEPNGDMQAAGAHAIRIDTTAINKIWTGNAVYRAMIAAAPTAPAAQGDALTDAQIFEIAIECETQGSDDSVLKFARAIAAKAAS